MAQWQDIGLVLAGSVGPLAVAIANGSFNRKLEMSRWRHQERDSQRDMYAHFIASANQLVADWLDYETLPPKSEEDERKLDEVHDAHYHELVILSAMVRITATPDVALNAEQLLATIRKAKMIARNSRAPDAEPIPSERWAQIDAEFAAARTKLINSLRRTHGNMDVDEEEQLPRRRTVALRAWNRSGSVAGRGRTTKPGGGATAPANAYRIPTPRPWPKPTPPAEAPAEPAPPSPAPVEKPAEQAATDTPPSAAPAPAREEKAAGRPAAGSTGEPTDVPSSWIHR